MARLTKKRSASSVSKDNGSIVMTGLRFNVPAETGLALLERVDPVLSPGFVDGADDDN